MVQFNRENELKWYNIVGTKHKIMYISKMVFVLFCFLINNKMLVKMVVFVCLFCFASCLKSSNEYDKCKKNILSSFKPFHLFTQFNVHHFHFIHFLFGIFCSKTKAKKNFKFVSSASNVTKMATTTATAAEAAKAETATE